MLISKFNKNEIVKFFINNISGYSQLNNIGETVLNYTEDIINTDQFIFISNSSKLEYLSNNFKKNINPIPIDKSDVLIYCTSLGRRIDTMIRNTSDHFDQFLFTQVASFILHIETILSLNKKGHLFKNKSNIVNYSPGYENDIENQLAIFNFLNLNKHGFQISQNYKITPTLSLTGMKYISENSNSNKCVYCKDKTCIYKNALDFLLGNL